MSEQQTPYKAKNKTTFLPGDAGFPTAPEGLNPVACVVGDQPYFIKPCFGGDIVKAQRIMKGKPDLYFPSLMHVLVRTADNRQLTAEEFQLLPGKTYSKLMKVISDELVDDDDTEGED